MEHQPDHCKTAEQVREAALKVRAFRQLSRPTIIEFPRPIEPIPEPEPVIRDWLFVDSNTSRANKWPSTFIRHIKSLVCKEFLVSLNDIDSARRSRYIVIPRHVAIFLSKTLTLKSYPDLARLFGGRDHTTLMFACKQTEKRMKADPDLCQQVLWLKDRLEQDLAEWRKSC
jgi:hypothetical protein